MNFTKDSAGGDLAYQQIMPFTLFSTPYPGLEYDFTLTVVKRSNVSGVVDSRNDTTVVTIYMVPGKPPEVSVQLLVERVNADTRLVVLGSIESRIPFLAPTWSVMRSHLDLVTRRTLNQHTSLSVLYELVC